MHMLYCIHLSLYKNRIYMEHNKLEQKIDIELSEAIADGEYVNLAIISHSTSEFVIDFVRMMPGVPKAKVKSRVILAPEHAKRLLLSLQDNIARYEAAIGQIAIPPTPEEAKMAFNMWGGGEA